MRSTRPNAFYWRDQAGVQQTRQAVGDTNAGSEWLDQHSSAANEPAKRPTCRGMDAGMMIEPEQLPLSRSQIIELLHQAEVMPTTQRVQIAEVLFSKPQHLSAEQILDQVSKLGHSISRATVYNTLGLFSSKGLVRQVIIDPDRVLYDPHTAPHHHFFNCDTGELIDIKSSAVQLKNIPELPANTSLANVEVVFELRQKD